MVHLLAALDTVAYYSMSYEVATKLWLIPSAMSGVLFPAFAASFTQDRNRTVQLFDRGVKYLFLILFPMVRNHGYISVRGTYGLGGRRIRSE